MLHFLVGEPVTITGALSPRKLFYGGGREGGGGNFRRSELEAAKVSIKRAGTVNVCNEYEQSDKVKNPATLQPSLSHEIEKT